MIHSFDTDIAKKYGLHTAIFYEAFRFWIKHNMKNEKNFYENKYWTYNSNKALQGVFPYMTKNQIEYTINKMVEQGILIKGNFNKSKYDRTTWYTLSTMSKNKLLSISEK